MKPGGLSVNGATVFVPEHRHSLEELQDELSLSSAEVLRLRENGIDSAPSAAGLSGPEMLDGVLGRLLERERVDPEQIRYLLLPYIYYAFPHSEDVLGNLRRKYGLKHALCFSLRDQLCSGYLLALYAAARWMEQEEAETSAIILASEKCILSDQRYGGGHILTGDAAAAVLLSKSLSGDRLLAVNNSTDIRTLQLGKLKTRQDEVPNYFYFVNLAKMIKRTLREAGICFSQLRLIIPNNVTPELWSYMARLLRVDTTKFYTEGIQSSGHLNTCDLPVNYTRIVLEQRVQPGEYYAMLSLGNGGVIGCAIFQKGECLPVLASCM